MIAFIFTRLRDLASASVPAFQLGLDDPEKRDVDCFSISGIESDKLDAFLYVDLAERHEMAGWAAENALLSFFETGLTAGAVFDPKVDEVSQFESDTLIGWWKTQLNGVDVNPENINDVREWLITQAYRE